MIDCFSLFVVQDKLKFENQYLQLIEPMQPIHYIHILIQFEIFSFFFTLARTYEFDECWIASSNKSMAIIVNAWLLVNKTGNNVRKAFNETWITRALWSFKHKRNVESNSAKIPNWISKFPKQKKMNKRFGEKLIL